MRDVSRIHSLNALPRLLAVAAGHSASLINVTGVEVKVAAGVNDSGLRGLHKLRDAAYPRFKASVVLYDGTATIPFGDNLYAVPLRALWENG